MANTSPKSPRTDADANAQEATQGPQPEVSTHSVAGTPAPAVPAALAAGALLGPYRLIEKLGEGGMGAVYKAQHEHLDMTVAVKVLPPHFTAHAQAVARFKREMKAVGKLKHPHIVQAHDAGEIGGVHYLAMEYVDGVDLNQYVKRKGPLSVTNACKTVRQAALALAAAHEAGLVHRDIKPSNLLVAKGGQLKLLDLGLARLANDGEPAQGVTTAGQTFGTPDYMAPEQWDDAHAVDGRCDLYSLGCTLFFLLTGRAPFSEHASLMQKMKAHGTLPPPDLRAALTSAASPSSAAGPSDSNENTVTLPQCRTIPDALVAIYEKLVAKRPEDRFSSAQELVAALDDVLAAVKTETVLPTPRPEDVFATLVTGDLPRGVRHRQRPAFPVSRRALASILGAVILFAGLIIVIKKRDGTTVKIPVDKGDKVEIVTDEPDDAPDMPPSNAIKTPDYAAERAAAEWVLSIGGTVTVVDNAGIAHSVTKSPMPGQAAAKAALPATPFTVRAVYLYGNQQVTDADLPRLHALTNLQGVHLAGCLQITDVGLAHLVRLPQLCQLIIDGTSVTERGVMLLGRSKSINSLFVSGLPVTIDGLRALRGLPLKDLVMTGTHLNYADLPELAVLFPDLGSFSCGNVLQGDVGAGLSPLAGLSQLHSLAVAPADLTAGPPHHLERFPSLRRLNIFYTPFSPGLAGRLEQLPRVTELVIHQPQFEGSAFHELCANTTLELLDLMAWSGGDAELLQLAGMKKLRELRLAGTKVTAAGAEEFHKRRPDVAITGDFNIPAEQKQPDYAKEREVAEWVLSVGGTVDVIDAAGIPQAVAQTPLPGQAAAKAALPASPFTVTAVNFHGNEQVTDAEVSRLEVLAKLERIAFVHCPRIADAGMPALGRIPSLERVTLYDAAVTDAGLAHLARLPKLQVLGLQYTRVTDQGIKQLGESRSLKELWLAGLPVTIEGLRALNNVPITFLDLVGSPDLPGSQLKYSDLPELATIFPNLQSFACRDLLGEVGAGLSPLASLANLQMLAADANDVAAGPPHDIERFPRLQQLGIYYAPFPQGLAPRLEQLPQVTQLLTRNCRFDDGAFAELCDNTTLESLQIEFWSGSDAELLQLTGMKKLRELRLAGTQVTKAGAAEFHKRRPDVAITGDFNIPAEPKQPDYAKEREVAEWVLSIGGTVTVVTPSGSLLNVSQLPLPAENFHVSMVSFHTNPNVTDSDLKRLADLSQLERLILISAPQITHAALVQLEPVKSLQELRLYGTKLTDESLRSVTSLPNLRVLQVGSAGITDAGLAEVAQCRQLEDLNLFACPVSIAGLRQLAGLKLKVLYVGSSKLRHSDLPDLVQLFPDMVELECRVRPDSTAGLSPLADLANLKILYLDPDEVVADAPHQLRKFSALREIRLKSPRQPLSADLFHRVAQLPQIESLTLMNAALEEGALSALANLQAVKTVSFTDCPVGDQDLQQLTPMAGLRQLTLSKTQVTSAGAEEFHKRRPDVAITGDFNLPIAKTDGSQPAPQ